jgi:phytoene dehydrogenase-like protein
MKKAVIVGSGMAGMTAAAFLARAGCEVDVFEQDDHIGGVTATLRRDGFAFDLGPMTGEGFGPGEPCGKILAELGIAGRLRFTRADRSVVFPDFRIVPPPEYLGPYWRRDRLKELFPAEAQGIDRYYEFYDTVMDLMTLDSFSKSTNRLAAPLVKLLMARPWNRVKDLQEDNAQQLMDGFFTDPKLQAVFLTLLADFTVRPTEFMGLGIPQLNPESQHDRRIPPKLSWWRRRVTHHFSIGGWGEVVQALSDVITGNGGRLHTSRTVTRVELDGGRVKGVELAGGERVDADIVLVSGAAREFMFELVGRDALPADLAAEVEGLTLMDSVFMVHLGVDMDPTPHQDAPVRYYYNTYEVEAGISHVQQGIYHEGKEGFVIYIPSLHSPAMAPDGQHCVTVYTIAPNELEGGWEARRGEMVEKLLLEAEKVLPGLREHARLTVSMTPEDFQRRTYMKRHAFAGLRPVMGTTGVPHQTPFEGLWFIGAQSESMGGLSNVVAGAHKVSRMALAGK